MVRDLANTEVKRGSGDVLMRTKTGELWSSVLLGPHRAEAADCFLYFTEPGQDQRGRGR